MQGIHTIVIGAGQAGLAMSHCLAERGIEHVVLEKGRIAERWRSQRWDSLRLLTPNWMSRLPGYRYRGPDPDGFMTMPETIDYLRRYAELSRAPVQSGTEVLKLRRSGGRLRVDTDRGDWVANNVVVATGYCDRPALPSFAAQLPAGVCQLTPGDYRNPGQLPPGGVLVVGAAASGIQIAHEVADAGRVVTLAAGRHTRLLRRYRGRDMLWWLDRMGLLDETVDDVFDIEVSRRQPAFQLAGRPSPVSMDLRALALQGVRVTGRALGFDCGQVLFGEELPAGAAAADAKLAALLARVDRFAEDRGLSAEAGEAKPFEPTWPVFLSAPPIRNCHLRAEGVKTVIWATGYRRGYDWLRLPVLDSKGEIRHRYGVTPQQGLYLLGMQFQNTRKSAFIDGVGRDARALARHIGSHTPRSEREHV